MKTKILAIAFLVIIFLAGCSKSNSKVIKDTASSQEVKVDMAEIKSTPEDLKSPVPEEPKNIDKTEENLKEEEVKQPATNKLLDGKTICIDAGHGNPNHAVKNEPIAPSSGELKPATAYGTTGISTKIPEYELTLAVSLKIRDELLKQGARVIMTRESNDVDLGNIERAEIANREAADIAVRIHADGVENTSVTGISVLFPGNQYIKESELLAKSKTAAKSVLDGLISSTGGKSRGIVERNDLTGFNWTKVPVILVEMGFMTNPQEDALLNTDEYQNRIVEGIVNGLINYFKK